MAPRRSMATLAAVALLALEMSSFATTALIAGSDGKDVDNPLRPQPQSSNSANPGSKIDGYSHNIDNNKDRNFETPIRNLSDSVHEDDELKRSIEDLPNEMDSFDFVNGGASDADIDKKASSVSSGMRYAGLGKRAKVNTAMRYAGIGKRMEEMNEDFLPDDPQQTETSSPDEIDDSDMDSWNDQYDDDDHITSVDDGQDYNKRATGENTRVGAGMRYAGLGKRGVGAGMRYAGLGKRGVGTGMRYAGLGKRGVGAGMRYAGLGKRGVGAGMRYAGIGKRGVGAGMRYAGLGKRGVGAGMRYAGLGKRAGVGAGMRYAGLGKRSVGAGMRYAGLGKRKLDIRTRSRIDAGMRYMGIGKRTHAP